MPVAAAALGELATWAVSRTVTVAEEAAAAPVPGSAAGAPAADRELPAR